MENIQAELPVQAEPKQENSIEELIRYEKKNLRINRIRLVCSLIAVALCVIIAVVLSVNVGRVVNEVEKVSDVMTEAGESINEVAKSLNEIDFATLEKSVETFADVGTETIRQIQNSTKDLDTILEEVRTSINRLGSVNIDELNNGIRTLNDVLEPLANFFHLFQ